MPRNPIGLAAVIGAFALAGLGAASADAKPTTRQICVTGDGSTDPIVCNSGASREEDVCTCPTPARLVDAPVCGPGEKPPPENAALRAARREALKSGHSLVGKPANGRPMCVEPFDLLGRH